MESGDEFEAGEGFGKINVESGDRGKLVADAGGGVGEMPEECFGDTHEVVESGENAVEFADCEFRVMCVVHALVLLGTM